jgi:cysteinyl-tRNA synthetase
VNYWIHCHHLIVDGEKMSKSKGNYYLLNDIIKKGFDPLALRLLLLSTHYRKMLNFTFSSLEQSQSSLQRIRDFVYELKNRSFPKGESEKVSKLIEGMTSKFSAGLSDDLNISVALTSFFEMIKKANILISKDNVYQMDAENLISAVKLVDQILAVLPKEETEALTDETQKKIEERQKAREEKNFALADRIRDELLQAGIMLEDTKDGGVRWKIKK